MNEFRLTKKYFIITMISLAILIVAQVIEAKTLPKPLPSILFYITSFLIAFIPMFYKKINIKEQIIGVSGFVFSYFVLNYILKFFSMGILNIFDRMNILENPLIIAIYNMILTPINTMIVISLSLFIMFLALGIRIKVVFDKSIIITLSLMSLLIFIACLPSILIAGPFKDIAYTNQAPFYLDIICTLGRYITLILRIINIISFFLLSLLLLKRNYPSLIEKNIIEKAVLI